MSIRYPLITRSIFAGVASDQYGNGEFEWSVTRAHWVFEGFGK